MADRIDAILRERATEQGDVEKVARIVDPRSWARFDCCYPFAAHIPREQGIAWTIELQPSLAKAREIIAALKASPPEGWVMVPVEPTPAMWMAWAKSLNLGAAWTAMLAAAPVKASPALQDEEAKP